MTFIHTTHIQLHLAVGKGAQTCDKVVFYIYQCCHPISSPIRKKKRKQTIKKLIVY